ncbi:non-heme iron oxygenase ferredoxin subunit [Mycolicibacterium austroafricanum]|jgi:3-phenylpropionate/trans-cinnamate dioxygenase ferredoxin subunit|uniref:non-heme iron oxygenase ferredoxin subunit n=1 Tax=Mycolicibacterium austroafricanum TaxID=39687 RepID=UPI000685AFD6|nr:non-heme iron oxygenase ferredoxin subunit [Mycolicibacterium austroafricanum]QZY44917.1 non-heme iron oxygenase ferredoxin subunit [Mycolicibacterium austroafricanum]
MSGLSEKELAGLPTVAGREWIRACATGELPDDGGHQIDTTPPVSVFAVAGEFFCIDDTCTHEMYSLADGWIEEKECVIECSLHMAKFCLRTGAALTPPASAPVAVHPVARVEDTLYVALPPSYFRGA